jgi:predicted Zn-dependent protease
MTAKTVTGYAARAELTRVMNSNTAAQAFLRRILNEQPGPQTHAMLLARIAASLGEQHEAITELQQIISNRPN